MTISRALLGLALIAGLSAPVASKPLAKELFGGMPYGSPQKAEPFGSYSFMNAFTRQPLFKPCDKSRLDRCMTNTEVTCSLEEGLTFTW